MLPSVDGVKSEYEFEYNFWQWNRMTKNGAAALSPPLELEASPVRPFAK